MLRHMNTTRAKEADMPRAKTVPEIISCTVGENIKKGKKKNIIVVVLPGCHLHQQL